MAPSSQALTQAYVRRLGDNVVILSQRLSEWVGKAPALEEDIALANVGLDLIGQARLWFSYAAELAQDGSTEDSIAFLRDAHQYHNLLLVEQPNGSYGDTLARQLLFDAWHYLVLQDLTRSKDSRLAEIAVKSLKEVTYHLRRSSDIVVRLGDGTDESKQRIQTAIDRLWMYTGELFTRDELDEKTFELGIAPVSPELSKRWHDLLHDIFEEATLTMPSDECWMQKGGKSGRHSEHLGYLLAEMQFLQRAYPGAQW